MERIRIWRYQQLLVLLLFINDSGLQSSLCIEEGSDATLRCPYNIMKYFYSLKAWQRVGSENQLETLIQSSTDGVFRQFRVGKYLLADNPPDAMMNFTILSFQKQDSGTYQCVIDKSPQKPLLLLNPFVLTTCDASIEITPGIPTPQKVTPRREEAPTTLPTKTKSLTNPTQPPVKSTIHSLTTTPEAAHNETISVLSRFSNVIGVTFGVLLNKILVFITLYILLQKRTGC
ncbi:triggering receptor expressed on myeloid cells 1 [Antechinus flavipes]|uniref:triggering receptor expressed on myeloid cells 1 n=1 Tax=Antechinus flavipes TaxID=38775 RepID=UPI00223604D7|nr:triggering receptor expressed on myeloid cells 1 [Antechinus flavipes]